MSLLEKSEMENGTDLIDEKPFKEEKVEYYLLEFNKKENKFIPYSHKFKDTLSEIDDLSKVLLSELILSHYKKNNILIPILEGKIIKDTKYLSEFKTPLLILKLDIRLLVKPKVKNLNRNLLNMDISNIISTILNQSSSSYSGQTENRDSDDDDDDETVNSQNDIMNMTSQLMNIYSNSMQNMQNIRTENMEKYKDEIEQMTNMGFDNREKIIQSLVVCNGNIEQAVNYYLTLQ